MNLRYDIKFRDKLDKSLSVLFVENLDGHDIYHLRRTCDYALLIAHNMKLNIDFNFLIKNDTCHATINSGVYLL